MSDDAPSDGPADGGSLDDIWVTDGAVAAPVGSSADDTPDGGASAPSAGSSAPAPVAATADDPAAHQRKVRMAQAGLVVLALVIFAAVFFVGGSDNDGDDGGNGGEGQEQADGGSGEVDDGKAGWPTESGGRPPALGTRGETADTVSVEAGTAPGVYVWSDFDGWHLWVVGGPDVPELTGAIRSDDEFAKAQSAVPARGTVAQEGQLVSFTLPAGEGLSGVDFNPGFFASQLVITIDGPTGPLDPQLIYLGSKAGPAPQPFVLTKS